MSANPTQTAQMSNEAAEKSESVKQQETISDPPKPVGKPKKPLSEAQLRRNELARERARAYHAKKKADELELKTLREKVMKQDAAREKREARGVMRQHEAKKKAHEKSDRNDEFDTELMDHGSAIVHAPQTGQRFVARPNGDIREHARREERREEAPKRIVVQAVEDDSDSDDGYIQRKSIAAKRAAKALEKVEERLSRIQATTRANPYLAMLLAHH